MGKSKSSIAGSRHTHTHIPTYLTSTCLWLRVMTALARTKRSTQTHLPNMATSVRQHNSSVARLWWTCGRCGSDPAVEPLAILCLPNETEPVQLLSGADGSTVCIKQLSELSNFLLSNNPEEFC